MKKKILFALTLIAVFVCLFAVAVSASPIAGYQQYEVELVDGSKITVYESAVWDQWQGRLNFTDATYTEPPLDTENTYPLLDWSQVVVADFTNGQRKQLNAETGEYVETYGTNDGFSMHINATGFTKANATNLKKIITGNATVVLGGTLNGLPALEEVVCGAKLKEIGWNAFDGNKKLKTVDFSACQNFKTFGYQAFANCTELENITLPNTITSMADSVFQNCSSLESLNWPTGMTKIPGSTFSGCSSLVFEIPSNITEIGGSAFRNCDALTVVNVPASVSKMGGFVFADCDSLTTVDFPSNSELTGKFDGIAFNCPNLTKFTMPSGITSLGYDNFWHCKSLSEIDISNITSITSGNNFADTNITRLVFSNNLVTLTSGNINSSKIEEIVLGANLKTIGAGSFNSKTIKRVYIPATVETIGSNILGWSNPADSSQNITFIYTGTREQAEALQAYYKEWTLANNPGHAPNSSKFYDAELVSAKDYDVTQEPVGFHFVYDYSQCDAFYNGVHGQAVTTYGFAGADYFTAYQSSTGCNRCTDKDVVDIANALFTYKGFSTDGNSIVYDIRINKDAIEKYNAATGKEIKYGIVASQIFNDGALLNNEGAIVDNRVVAAEFSSFDYTILQIKILNVAEDLKTTPIHCCAYIVDGSKVKYLYDTKDAEGKAVPNAFDVANQVTYAQANG